MEKLEHPLWIVHLVNALFGPLVAAALRPLGIVFQPGQEVIPDFIVMSLLILVGVSVLCLLIRSRLSVENPGKLQIFARGGGHVPLRDGRRVHRAQGPQLRDARRDDVHLHPVREPDGTGPRAEVADEQHQRHARLRADGVRLLPVPRVQGAGPRRLREALHGAAAARPCGSPRSTSRSRSSATCRACCRSRCGCSATSSARTWSSSSSPASCRSWCRCR